MLQAICDKVPELFPYCYNSYAHPSIYGSDTAMSQEGPQQGDRVDSLLFINTLQPLLQSLSSALTLGYLDDVTLGRSIDTLAADVQTIITHREAMGLCLNNTKCEIIAHQQYVITDPTLCSFSRVNIEDAT